MKREGCSEECDGMHAGSHAALEVALKFISTVGCFGEAHRVLDLLEEVTRKYNDEPLSTVLDASPSTKD